MSVNCRNLVYFRILLILCVFFNVAEKNIIKYGVKRSKLYICRVALIGDYWNITQFVKWITERVRFFRDAELFFTAAIVVCRSRGRRRCRPPGPRTSQRSSPPDSGSTSITLRSEVVSNSWKFNYFQLHRCDGRNWTCPMVVEPGASARELVYCVLPNQTD
jgi:hypothetical protein